MSQAQEATMHAEPVRTRRRRARARACERGQAMLEYSMLNWVLVVGLVLGCSVKMIPGAAATGTQGGYMNVIEMFLFAYQIYYDSFYFVLNLPFP